MKSKYLLPLNTRVKLGLGGSGKIVGYGTIFDDGGPPRQMYLVDLDEGFWAEYKPEYERTLGRPYITTLVVDPSAIEEPGRTDKVVPEHWSLNY